MITVLKEKYLWYMLFAGIGLGVIITLVLIISIDSVYDSNPKIDLPEEYKFITPHEQIQGNYDPCTNTLHIWFNNKNK